MNVCGVCGLDFGSVRAFDAHHVGDRAYLYEEGLAMTPPRVSGFRCLTKRELEAQGFVRNKFGRFTLPDILDRGRRFTARTPALAESMLAKKAEARNAVSQAEAAERRAA